VWKRHSEFQALVRSLKKYPTTYENTLSSWACVLQRKKFLKCLESQYLSLKCFLLERFVHDFLFESPTPQGIVAFLGLDPQAKQQ
jgi:hypothetical protein